MRSVTHPSERIGTRTGADLSARRAPPAFRRTKNPCPRPACLDEELGFKTSNRQYTVFPSNSTTPGHGPTSG